MQVNTVFKIVAGFGLFALTLCLLTEPSYYDWERFITCSVIGILVYDKFVQFKSQPEIKRPAYMTWIVSFVLSLASINLLDAIHFDIISMANHGLCDAGVLAKKHLDWERYMFVYICITGAFTVSICTMLLTYFSGIENSFRKK